MIHPQTETGAPPEEEAAQTPGQDASQPRQGPDPVQAGDAEPDGSGDGGGDVAAFPARGRGRRRNARDRKTNRPSGNRARRQKLKARKEKTLDRKAGKRKRKKGGKLKAASASASQAASVSASQAEGFSGEILPASGSTSGIEVPPAQARSRHWAILVSFLVVVLLPFALASGYLYTRAADQYHSETAFSIRSEEQSSAAAGLLGAITQINPGSASEADILFEFIRSQKIVENIDDQLDLRTIFNRAENDPYFTLGPDATIEDLLDYWRSMVEVSYESSAGIIHVRANAFAPEDAQAITTAVLAESSRVVNLLSEQAREDAVRFAREELEEAEAHLRDVRKRMADFRRTNRIVDPSADIAGQMGLLNALQQELAQALVERDVLLSYAAEDDQRVIQANRRISAITEQIEEERQNLGVGGVDGVLPEVVGTYEELLVDIEFANTAYTQALASLAAARAEARRQSRYLAPHVRPTLAQSALYPRRTLLAGLTGLFLVLGWGTLMLIYYNVRDSN